MYQQKAWNQVSKSGLFSTLLAYQKSLKNNRSITFDSFVSDLPLEQGDLTKRNLLVEISMFSCLSRLIHLGLTLDKCLDILQHVDAVTIRKVGDRQLTSSQDLRKKISSHTIVTWVKYGDVGHNITTLTPFLKSKGDTSTETWDKYNDYMDTLFTA
jgi:hypothetical protein